MRTAFRCTLVGCVVAAIVPPLDAQERFTVRAENTLAIARNDETIALAWKEVSARIPTVKPGEVRVRGVGDAEIVSQAVDNDGDGATDELIFQSTFIPNEVKLFTIEAGRASAMPAKARVFAMHTDPRDDVAWESDRVAFRIYGQGLWKVDSLLSSGIDVWVKRVRDPIVDKWYKKGHDAYHIDTGEGADFFDVGQTLGAGGTGIWRRDTLYRAWNFKSWRIIANGPVRLIFELQYQPWDAGGLQVTETKRVSLDAGHNLNHVVSTFRADGGATEIPWVTGLVKRKSVVGSQSKAQPWAWLSVWGPVSPKDGGHGDLGTAVILPRNVVTDWKETDNHYLAIARGKSGEPQHYWIGAGWTDSGDYRDVRDWWTYLDQWAHRLGTPIKLTVEAARKP